MKKLSQITQGLIGQPMFKVLSKVRELEDAGRKIVHFEIGDSDFRAYQHIIDATKEALDADMTHYVESRGIASLREAICSHTERTLGFRPTMEQVLVMPSNAIIDFVVRCVADPGDDVIYPDPGFSTYIAVTSYTGVRKVGVPLFEWNGFHLKAEDVKKKITPRTRLLAMNSPHNPTGAVMTRKEVEEMALLAEEQDIYLLSDEIYSNIIFEGHHYSPACLDHCKDRTIILNGFAKNYSMPGWRLGYVIGPEAFIEKMSILFQTTYSCLPPFIQYAGIRALQSDSAVLAERLQQQKMLRNLIVKKLNEIPGVRCACPEGACYVFPNITGTGLSSAAFTDLVLRQAGVALLPGTCFGPFGQGHVRLCYMRSPDTIVEACERMKKVLAGRVIETRKGRTCDAVCVNQ